MATENMEGPNCTVEINQTETRAHLTCGLDGEEIFSSDDVLWLADKTREFNALPEAEYIRQRAALRNW